MTNTCSAIVRSDLAIRATAVLRDGSPLLHRLFCINILHFGRFVNCRRVESSGFWGYFVLLRRIFGKMTKGRAAPARAFSRLSARGSLRQRAAAAGIPAACSPGRGGRPDGLFWYSFVKMYQNDKFCLVALTPAALGPPGLCRGGPAPCKGRRFRPRRRGPPVPRPSPLPCPAPRRCFSL